MCIAVGGGERNFTTVIADTNIPYTETVVFTYIGANAVRSRFNVVRLSGPNNNGNSTENGRKPARAKTNITVMCKTWVFERAITQWRVQLSMRCTVKNEINDDDRSRVEKRAFSSICTGVRGVRVRREIIRPVIYLRGTCRREIKKDKIKITV